MTTENLILLGIVLFAGCLWLLFRMPPIDSSRCPREDVRERGCPGPCVPGRAQPCTDDLDDEP